MNRLPRESVRDNSIESYRLTFGRFTGKRLTEVPADYLLWLADNAESETLRNLARQQLGLEPADLGPDPSPEAASVVLPGVIFEWLTTMQQKHAGRPLALDVVRDGCEVLKSICTRYTRKQWLDDTEAHGASTSRRIRRPVGGVIQFYGNAKGGA